MNTCADYIARKIIAEALFCIFFLDYYYTLLILFNSRRLISLSDENVRCVLGFSIKVKEKLDGA
jgi:hypothetical protein